MDAAEEGGHPIKVALLLSVSEADVMKRWETVHEIGRRDLTHTVHTRADDASEATFKMRMNEFNEKTVPVLQSYQAKGMLLPVKASLDRESVFNLVVDELYRYTVSHGK